MASLSFFFYIWVFMCGFFVCIFGLLFMGFYFYYFYCLFLLNLIAFDYSFVCSHLLEYHDNKIDVFFFLLFSSHLLENVRLKNKYFCFFFGFVKLIRQVTIKIFLLNMHVLQNDNKTTWVIWPLFLHTNMTTKYIWLFSCYI